MTEHIHSGMLLDEQNEISLEELMQACSCDIEWVIELVNEGILEPIDKDSQQWCFSGVSLLRAHTTMRLQKDLGVNLAGAALALDLMLEIETLRARIK